MITKILCPSRAGAPSHELPTKLHNRTFARWAGDLTRVTLRLPAHGGRATSPKSPIFHLCVFLRTTGGRSLELPKNHANQAPSTFTHTPRRRLLSKISCYLKELPKVGRIRHAPSPLLRLFISSHFFIEDLCECLSLFQMTPLHFLFIRCVGQVLAAQADLPTPSHIVCLFALCWSANTSTHHPLHNTRSAHGLSLRSPRL